MVVKMTIRQINTTQIGVVLEAMPAALANKAIKPMIERVSSMGAKRMKANYKRVRRKARKGDRWQSSGALLASIGVKSPVKLMKGGTAMFGGFGIRRNQAFIKKKLKSVRSRLEKKTTFGFKRNLPRGSVRLADNKSKKGLQVRPSRYAHLVERGHGGPIPSKPYPFVRPTAIEMEGVFRHQAPQILKELFPKIIAAEGRRLSRSLRV